MKVVIEPIVRVERVVAQVVEQGSVKRIVPRPGGENHLRAATAEFRRKIRCLDTELLEGVNRYEIIGSAGGAKSRKGARRILAPDGRRIRSEIGACTINREIVGVGAIAVNAELSLLALVLRGGQDHAGRELQQRMKAAA